MGWVGVGFCGCGKNQEVGIARARIGGDVGKIGSAALLLGWGEFGLATWAPEIGSWLFHRFMVCWVVVPRGAREAR